MVTLPLYFDSESGGAPLFILMGSGGDGRGTCCAGKAKPANKSNAIERIIGNSLLSCSPNLPQKTGEERRRGQTLAIVQVAIGVAAPGIAHTHRELHLGALQQDRPPFEFSFGRYELPARSRQFKAANRAAIARLESRAEAKLEGG